MIVIRVKVFGQKKAEKICRKLNGRNDKKCVVISITDPGQSLADIHTGGAVYDIFRMSFYDLETDVKFLRGFYPCATIGDLRGLRTFVDKWRDVDVLIVHCAAGISRSAAVAAAIEQYLGLEDTIRSHFFYHPNGHVFKLCLDEFGLTKSEEYYSSVFVDVI